MDDLKMTNHKKTIAEKQQNVENDGDLNGCKKSIFKKRYSAVFRFCNFQA